MTVIYMARLHSLINDPRMVIWLRDGPLEKLWGAGGGGGGVGNFRAAGFFFRKQIPCMNFFRL